jgi:guanine nucleotide-binding protein subunit alpha
MPHKNLPTADIEDPLTLVTLPNEDETPEQQQARELAEAQAKKVSEDIDDQIRQDRVAFKRRQKAMKVLVLGQSESGQFCIYSLLSYINFGR